MGPLRLAVGPNIAIDAIPLRRASTDVRELLRSSLDILRDQALACDITLRLQVADNVPATISIDRLKIAWAITALAGSAVRYVRHGSRTMPGGTIAVNAAFDPVTHEITVEVQDDGPGIAADRLPTLFDGAGGAHGAALGLMMVRDVVTAHGGRFEVASDTSRVSHGTTVRLTLPAT